MAIYKIFPSKDTTLYSEYKTLNTGLDSILDLTKVKSDLYNSSSVARVLMQFDSSEVTDTINNKIATGSWKSYLKMYNATSEGLASAFNIEIHPLYQSWDMGTGRYGNIPEVEDGASWQYRNADQSTAWTVSGLPTGVTSSYYAANPGGGSWYTASATQSFSYYTTKDISADVTSLVKLHYSGTISNNGFIILNSTAASNTNTGSFEFDPSYQQQFNFFSRDTNTIYPPCLEFRWDDSVFVTGGSSVVTNENINVSLGNNKQVFYEDEYAKIRVYARDKYPTRTFTTSSLYRYNKLLPQTTYYSVIDLNTNNRIIDFDTNYTKVSCDSTSNYFRLYMNGLEPDRYYKIQVKSVIDGGTYIFDNDYYFKVIQNV